MKPRIYVDASVVGGCEDDEFSEHSVPSEVRKHLAAVPEAHIATLQLGAEARKLAEAYIAEGVISAKMRADAQHIAMGTVARVDVLVSWNFKHIVNLYRIHGDNSVNLRRGYPTLEIRRHGRYCRMNRTRKTFDAVAMMRSIRDRVSAQIEGMTLEEELAWLASQELKDPFLERLRDRAAQQQQSLCENSSMWRKRGSSDGSPSRDRGS
ncbi:MAG TPA: hypothetical protein VGA37_03510 [Gemmatimonadales bacterium]